jgi:hypothetical protein
MSAKEEADSDTDTDVECQAKNSSIVPVAFMPTTAPRNTASPLPFQNAQVWGVGCGL